MPRTRRYIRSNRPYELCIRVKEGLPFATLQLIRTLIESTIARTQRDSKVTLVHMVWMGNHFHALLIAHDCQQYVNFYQEIQKKITEYMKKLLGKPRLSLWEGDPIVAEILDIDACINRIAYFYANPAAANLVDSIDSYPGLTSWNEFLTAENSVEAQVSRNVPWIQLPYVPKLSSLALSDAQDSALTKRLKLSAKHKHQLTLTPNAWMKPFGISHPMEISALNKQVITKVRTLEAVAREARSNEKKTILGANRLCRQPIMASHTPPPRERRVYVISTIVELRIDYILAMKRFCDRCAECYRAMRDGLHSINWPPGAIRPALRPVANAIVPIFNLI